MKRPKPHQESDAMLKEMPFQVSFPQIHNGSLLSEIEKAKLAFPIFGGTTPITTTTKENESSTEASKSNDSQSTGSEDSTTPDGKTSTPELTTEEIASLLEQVTNTNNKLTEATKKLNKFESDKQANDRAQMGKEEALSADLETAQQTIIKMDAALKNQAVINAINSFKDVQFHDNLFVMRELQASASEIFEDMEVDLDNGTVTVKGVENHLRRIAKEKDWAVKKNNIVTSDQNGSSTNSGTPRAPRSSGAPPANPTVNASKADRRKALADKFPVISHGRKL